MTDKELEKIYNEAYRAVYWTAFSLLKTPRIISQARNMLNSP